MHDKILIMHYAKCMDLVGNPITKTSYSVQAPRHTQFGALPGVRPCLNPNDEFRLDYV